ncbi:MAG: hypothetical protein HY863_03405 [Chloroflexi bacterium]|nr:hypothetical protein [Chloroflexota bacterium]
MFKKIVLLSMFLLTSCISIKTDSVTATPDRSGFVTATLPPTRVGFVPATLTPSPEATIHPTLAVTAPANCKDSAVLLRDVTIPDNAQMEAGEKFTKTWEFQNTGKCPWKDYTLAFDSGDQMNAPLSAPVPDTAPKDKVQVSVELAAPSADGAYTGYFTLNDSAGNSLAIGIEKTFWVKILVGNVSPQSTSASTPFVPGGGNSNCAYTQNGGYVQEIISLINQARAAANIPTLTVNSILTAAAQSHSADMACNNFLGHTGSDGSSIYDRLLRAGYTGVGFSEIIAIGTPQNAMSQWRADQGHWDVVLNAGVTEIGVGYAYYSSSDFGGYITVDMGGQ